MRRCGRLAAFTAALCCAAPALRAPLDAQQARHSTGFFFGVDAEGDRLLANVYGTTTISESGTGFGLMAGYGFSPLVALYALGSAAVMSASGGGSYLLGHYGIGTRVRLANTSNVVVPFLQVGASRRELSGLNQNIVGPADFSGRGSWGLSLGAGLDAYVSARTALSGGVVWSAGTFNGYYQHNVTSASTVSATSTRAHVGAIWFPGA